jgi:isopentenyl-diphosphate delta-isomerase
LQQELGITGIYPSHRDTVEYRADVGGGLTEHEVVDIYVADADPSLSVVPNPDEVADTRWVDLYDLAAEVSRWPERFTPWLRIYLEKYQDRIFGSLTRA